MITIARRKIKEFVYLLRNRGIKIGLDEHVNAQLCYDAFFQESKPNDSESSLFLGLRSVLVKSEEDYDTFSKAYEDFFLFKDYSGHGIGLVPRFAREERQSGNKISDVAIPKSEEDGEKNTPESKRKAILSLYSGSRSQIPPIDLRNLKPFRSEDTKDIARNLRKMSRLNQALPGRRKCSNPGYKSGVYVDWRKLARFVSSNPDAIPKLHFMDRKPTHSKLVVLADVSGSMLKEVEIVINSLFTTTRRFHGTEVFVFSTGLTRLTPFFSNAHPNLETIQRFCSKQTEIELGSGTRIGENFARLLRDFPAAISHESTLIIISDGWDLGDSRLLETCFQEVKKRGAKIVWFHPHFGHPDFSPETLAMKTALPYIDLMTGPLNRVN